MSRSSITEPSAGVSNLRGMQIMVAQSVKTLVRLGAVHTSWNTTILAIGCDDGPIFVSQTIFSSPLSSSLIRLL